MSSENPRDGVQVSTNEGPATQWYLPLCSPEELDGKMRPVVGRFILLLQGMLRHFDLTEEEAQDAVVQVFRQRGRH